MLIIYIIKNNNKNINQILIVVLIFLVNLRIMIPSHNSQILANNLDVLFVVDNTISMNAEDYDGNNTRLFAVKKDCTYIIKRLAGARFSLITFNNTAKIITPYTKDFNITAEAIDIIEPINELYAKGSSLNTPLDTIIDSLKSSEEKEDRIRVLFFISDGEITDDSSLKSYNNVAKYVHNGAVLGYGTSKGGYMKAKNRWDENTEYIMDYSDYKYDKAVSKIDEKNLKSIASDIKIDYINMEKQSNINHKLKEIENMVDKGIESSNKSTYNDTYYFLIIPLLVLTMLEFNKFRRKNI
jgi:Ca-activated chloride channel family protein